MWKRGFASVTGTAGLLNRTPRELALRACCTQLLLTRWTLESAALSHKNDLRGMEGFKALNETIRKTKINEFMTQRELELMGKDYASWDVVQDIIPTELRWESFGAKPEHIVSSPEFAMAVSQSEAWYWRSRAQIVLDLKKSLSDGSEEAKIQKKKLPSGLNNVMMNIEQAIEMATQRAISDGLIFQDQKSDFIVFKDTKYNDMEDHDMRDVGLLAEARLAALGWMTGTHEWEYERGELRFINPMGSLWSPEE
ncbi:hypothetical protein HDV06_005779 [Boothiomyces sp. JEL0866]|nr:hypothetical protein HDV06_005779 [Boothiomyces sp. JEL0866]